MERVKEMENHQYKIRVKIAAGKIERRMLKVVGKNWTKRYFSVLNYLLQDTY